MSKRIFKKVQKHAIFKINNYVIWAIFLKCSSNILLDLFWSYKKCKIYHNFFGSSCFFFESKMVAYMQQKVTKKNFFFLFLNVEFYAL